jgi:hypothetical protein
VVTGSRAYATVPIRDGGGACPVAPKREIDEARILADGGARPRPEQPAGPGGSAGPRGERAGAGRRQHQVQHQPQPTPGRRHPRPGRGSRRSPSHRDDRRGLRRRPVRLPRHLRLGQDMDRRASPRARRLRRPVLRHLRLRRRSSFQPERRLGIGPEHLHHLRLPPGHRAATRGRQDRRRGRLGHRQPLGRRWQDVGRRGGHPGWRGDLAPEYPSRRGRAGPAPGRQALCRRLVRDQPGGAGRGRRHRRAPCRHLLLR